MKPLLSKSDAATRALGRKLARRLKGGDCLCLVGDLGSGKTTFMQGVAEGLGCPARATSPTFVLAKTHHGRRWTLYHLDLYRVAEGATGDIGLEEFLADPQGICAVEWPRSGAPFLPKDHVELRFAHRSENERAISWAAPGPRGKALVQGLA